MLRVGVCRSWITSSRNPCCSADLLSYGLVSSIGVFVGWTEDYPSIAAAYYPVVAPHDLNYRPIAHCICCSGDACFSRAVWLVRGGTAGMDKRYTRQDCVNMLAASIPSSGTSVYWRFAFRMLSLICLLLFVDRRRCKGCSRSSGVKADE